MTAAQVFTIFAYCAAAIVAWIVATDYRREP